MYLSLRFFLSQGSKAPPLDYTQIQQLIANAMNLHDRQLKMRSEERERDKHEDDRRQKEWERRRAIWTMIGAGIAGAASIANLIWSFVKAAG